MVTANHGSQAGQQQPGRRSAVFTRDIRRTDRRSRGVMPDPTSARRRRGPARIWRRPGSPSDEARHTHRPSPAHPRPVARHVAALATSFAIEFARGAAGPTPDTVPPSPPLTTGERSRSSGASEDWPDNSARGSLASSPAVQRCNRAAGARHLNTVLRVLATASGAVSVRRCRRSAAGGQRLFLQLGFFHHPMGKTAQQLQLRAAALDSRALHSQA